MYSAVYIFCDYYIIIVLCVHFVCIYIMYVYVYICSVISICCEIIMWSVDDDITIWGDYMCNMYCVYVNMYICCIVVLYVYVYYIHTTIYTIHHNNKYNINLIIQNTLKIHLHSIHIHRTHYILTLNTLLYIYKTTIYISNTIYTIYYTHNITHIYNLLIMIHILNFITSITNTSLSTIHSHLLLNITTLKSQYIHKYTHNTQLYI